MISTQLFSANGGNRHYSTLGLGSWVHDAFSGASKVVISMLMIFWCSVWNREKLGRQRCQS